MTLLQPPSYMENRNDHTAQEDRLVLSSAVNQGVALPGHLAVTAQATPNMSVVVAAGRAYIKGSTTNQGTYHAVNDANLTANISAADTSYGRIDVVALVINDAYYAGSTNEVDLVVVPGTPSPTPTVPTLPNNAIELAEIAVGANVTSITNSNITDKRPRATNGLSVLPWTFTSTTIPAGQYVGEMIYNTTTDQVMVWNGSSWDYLQVVSDTNWVNITPASGFSAAGDAPQYRIKNGNVWLHGTFTKGSNIANGDLLCNLPAAARPATSFQQPVSGSTGAGSVRCSVSNGGNINVQAPMNGSTTYVSITGISYPLG